MKSLYPDDARFEEMGGTYRQVGDYFIPNLALPDTGNYQIGKYGNFLLSPHHRHSLCGLKVFEHVNYCLAVKKS